MFCVFVTPYIEFVCEIEYVLSHVSSFEPRTTGAKNRTHDDLIAILSGN